MKYTGRCSIYIIKGISFKEVYGQKSIAICSVEPTETLPYDKLHHLRLLTTGNDVIVRSVAEQYKILNNIQS